MNSRAWAFAAMICALLLGAPTSLADQDEGFFSLLTPVTDVLEDACTSMLEVTMVSFGGTITEVDSPVLDVLGRVLGGLTDVHAAGRPR